MNKNTPKIILVIALFGCFISNKAAEQGPGFTCDLCAKTCNRSYDLNRHVKRHFSKTRGWYKCEYCNCFFDLAHGVRHREIFQARDHQAEVSACLENSGSDEESDVDDDGIVLTRTGIRELSKILARS